MDHLPRPPDLQCGQASTQSTQPTTTATETQTVLQSLTGVCGADSGAYPRPIRPLARSLPLTPHSPFFRDLRPPLAVPRPQLRAVLKPPRHK